MQKACQHNKMERPPIPDSHLLKTHPAVVRFSSICKEMIKDAAFLVMVL
jgi:hypothetical protein